MIVSLLSDADCELQFHQIQVANTTLWNELEIKEVG